MNQPRHFIGIIVWGCLMLTATHSALLSFVQIETLGTQIVFLTASLASVLAFGVMFEKCNKKIQFHELSTRWSLKIYKQVSVPLFVVSGLFGVGAFVALTSSLIPIQHSVSLMQGLGITLFFAWTFEKMETRCDNCNTQVLEKAATYCSKCGTTLKPKTIHRPICGRCNHPCEPGSNYCTKCRNNLTQPL